MTEHSQEPSAAGSSPAQDAPASTERTHGSAAEPEAADRTDSTPGSSSPEGQTDSAAPSGSSEPSGSAAKPETAAKPGIDVTPGDAADPETAADLETSAAPESSAQPGNSTGPGTTERQESVQPQGPPDAPAAEPEVRESRATPVLPREEAETAESASGADGFFDTLDERISAVTGRIAGRFSRNPQDLVHDDDPAPEADSEEDPPGDAGETPSSETTHAAEATRGTDLTSRLAFPHPEGRGTRGRGARHEGGPRPWEAESPPQRSPEDQRQRDAILEKATAIEAAAALNEPEPAVEYADDEDYLYTYIPPYNLPSRDPDPEPTGTDLLRQIYVSIGALAAVASALWMSGLLSGSVVTPFSSGLGSHMDGLFSGERALLSPDANFYWLWPLIAVGLVLHAVFQWTTTQISTPRQRRSGWQVGTAALLMLGWAAAVQAEQLTLATLAALAVSLALVDAIRQFTFHTARTSTERRFTDGPVGLFAGWALVAAMSAISIWLTAMQWRVPGFPAVLWALIGLVICIWFAAYYSMTERGRITIALGMGWGMLWLVFPRLLSDVVSVWVAIGAAMGAFVVILATQSRRHRINHAERRAAMGRPVDDII